MRRGLRKATCCCGACSIEVEGEPAVNGACHCQNCQKRTDSAFGWSSYFVDGQMWHKHGDFNAYLIAGANPQQRWICAKCGSTLFWKAAFMLEHTGIAGGCFAGNALGAPSVTVSNEGRCAWLTLPAGWRTSL